MSKSNCKRMTLMMSLYVAGDLVGEREAVSHLAVCEGCRQLAAAFSESSRLLAQACAQPDFGAEFYNGIRSSVLAKITSEGIVAEPTPFGQLWGRRWLYSASLAAIVIATVMLQHFSGIQRRPAVGSAPQATGQPTTAQTKEANSSSPHQSLESPREPHVAAVTQRRPRSVFAVMDSRGAKRQIEAVREPDALVATGTAPESRKIATAMLSSTNLDPAALESVTSIGRSASSPSEATSSSEVSRIEIQTADPNIRIIWLAPRDSGKSEETNHDQDPYENADRN